MLMTVENRIEMPPEIAIEADKYQFIQQLNRDVMDEYLEQRDQEINRTVQEAMLSGNLTSYYTPDRIVTPGRVMKNNHAKSAWFKHAAHLELKNPSILNFSFSTSIDEEEMEENEDEVATLLQRLGQQTYMWSTSEKLTVFTATPSKIKFLPGDISKLETQESASGLVFASEADPGKIGKRLRAFGVSLGDLFDPKPSIFPNLNLGGDKAFRIKIRDSGTVGDGGGSCPEFIARKIIGLSGAPTWGDIIAFQIVVLGADFSFKALINIVPNELWTDQSTDLLLDAKSVNHQVHSTLVTVGKVMPTRHKKNKRHFYVEPMNLGEVVNRFIEAEQLTQQDMVIVEKVDRETWKHAMDRSRDLQEEVLEMLDESEEDWTKRSHIQNAARMTPEEKNGLMLAYNECQGSPFGLPSITNLVAGGPAKYWAHQLSNSRKRSGKWEDKKDKPTLSGITVSGEKLLLMDPGYAGVTYPRKGYIRLVWHPRKHDQLIGVALSKADTLRLRDAFDGMDVDGDTLQLIPMQDDRGKPLGLLMRSPMSIDGGACLRLTLQDAAKLREVGYHFYQKTGEHKYPGLYQIENGVQLYPDKLFPQPHENPPQWTTDPQLMVRRTLEMIQYRGIMGLVCLAVANLDYAGLYDPARHKFNMSNGVIDPSLYGTDDPTRILLHLQEAILEAIRQGIPLDRCLFHRIRRMMRELWEERYPGKKFEPKLTCQPHHHEWKEGQEAAIDFLIEMVNQRGHISHGPEEWLTTTFRTKLYNLVVRALEERMSIWTDKAENDRETRNMKNIKWQQKDAMQSVFLRDAKDAESTVIKEAYQKAVRTVDDLEPGQFMATWVQATISRAKRFRRSEPINVGALYKLPPKEVRGFYRKGESNATAIIRAEEMVQPAEGTACYVEEITKSGSRTPMYKLVSSEDGEIIADLRSEAQFCLGLDLEFAGYIPQLRVTLRKDNHWEQTETQMILRVNNPQDA